MIRLMDNSTGKNNSLNFDTSSYILVTIYSITLLGGIIGIFFMTIFLKNSQNKLSITTISIINLVLVHGSFLFSVPLIMEYYATGSWKHPFILCKLVSISLHTHLYLSFFFYVAILVVRFLLFFGRKPRDFYRPLYAFIASAVVWIVIFVSLFPPLLVEYGKHQNYNKTKCFQFQAEFKRGFVIVFNMVIVAAFILVSLLLVLVQIFILTKVIISNKTNLRSRQEFRAQLKNLSFIMILIICFLPYHIFRIHYVNKIAVNPTDTGLSQKNDIYLSITTLCCLDLLTLLARGY
ncbi:probable G-protein coupled receptor 141 [Lepisosteus oculatus]|uniref:probable G-protein coupled receptor 141 n=1 Tax=Lepisosteus oculatus TaxID=7918 RepID=UPI0007403474|nr:PREDICTED: probable G-protein coupled receptor 141 [Lepisosteus oculatus]XP_015209913.1 PREDICTED: probable G-protein coupled receptor 141 [Lepisosteus oculatus]XP_015209914.1 PREDICTED: probable G-protein coupled receptor 141 [Lepisosteus oculatus]